MKPDPFPALRFLRSNRTLDSTDEWLDTSSPDYTYWWKTTTHESTTGNADNTDAWDWMLLGGLPVAIVGMLATNLLEQDHHWWETTESTVLSESATIAPDYTTTDVWQSSHKRDWSHESESASDFFGIPIERTWTAHDQTESEYSGKYVWDYDVPGYKSHHESTYNSKYYDRPDETVAPDGTGTLSHATNSEYHGTWNSNGTSTGPGYYDTWWDKHAWNSDSSYSAAADIFDHSSTLLTSYTNSNNSDYDYQWHNNGNSSGDGSTHSYSNDWHHWGDSIWQEAYDETSQSNKGSHSWNDHWTSSGWWTSTWTDADGNTQGDGGSYSDAWDSGDSYTWDNAIDPVNWVGQRLSASSSWSILGSAFSSMVGQLEQEFQQMVADARANAASPGVFLETAVNAAGEHSVDATIGFLDGLFESLNPVGFWWEIPDIGPIYGHTDAYAAGNIAGMATGIVGTVLLTGGSGLAVCGTKLGTLAKVYNTVNNIAGAAAAVHASVNIASGNGTLKDGLALTGFLPAGGPKCFLRGTLIHLDEEWTEQIASQWIVTAFGVAVASPILERM